MGLLRWLWFTPVVFFVLRIVGGRFAEAAVDQRDPAPAFGQSLLANAEAFSVGMYLVGLSGFAFVWFAWALRRLLRSTGGSPWADLGFASGALWGTLYVVGAAVAATAPVLAGPFQDAEGARLVTNVELASAPLALTLFGTFALGNGVALRRTPAVPNWLAWTGVVVGGLLALTAALQPVVDPTISRSDPEVSNVGSLLSGLGLYALIPLWSIAIGVALFRRAGFTPEGRAT